MSNRRRQIADFLMWVLLFSPCCLVLIALAGCTSPVVHDRPVPVSIPVPQPCAGARPDPVTPLKAEAPDAEWRGLDARQKAARVGRKGLEWQAYGEQLNAATAACPEAPAGESK